MSDKKDLVVLIADKDAEFGIKSLLENRREDLNICRISFECVKHPYHDGGVRTRAHEFLQNFLNRYQRALVILDLEGCGREERHSAEQIEAEVEERLSANGWQNRCAAIVVEPELEIWLWDHRLKVRKVINGMRFEEAKQKLTERGFLTDQNQIKPAKPKEAFDFLLKSVRKPHSSSLFTDLG